MFEKQVSNKENKMSREKPKTPSRKGIARAYRLEKRKKAEERQARRDSRSNKEQLALLDKNGYRAEKERKKLEQNNA